MLCRPASDDSEANAEEEQKGSPSSTGTKEDNLVEGKEDPGQKRKRQEDDPEGTHIPDRPSRGGAGLLEGRLCKCILTSRCGTLSHHMYVAVP